jgi:hypothetical protein
MKGGGAGNGEGTREVKRIQVCYIYLYEDSTKKSIRAGSVAQMVGPA